MLQSYVKYLGVQLDAVVAAPVASGRVRRFVTVAVFVVDFRHPTEPPCTLIQHRGVFDGDGVVVDGGLAFQPPRVEFFHPRALVKSPMVKSDKWPGRSTFISTSRI